MSRLCSIGTSGGKGNAGMFFERNSQICAAGLPTLQPDERVSDSLKHFLLQDEADALIHDAVIPTPKRKPLPPLRKPIPYDTRHAGIYTESKNLINPQRDTKFRHLACDLKDTVFSSYWNKPTGVLPDRKSMLPVGFDTSKTRGKKYDYSDNVKDLLTQPIPYSDVSLPKQTDRKYCKPAFNPDLCFGHKTSKDVSGRVAKCHLTNESIMMGTSLVRPISALQADFKIANESKLGLSQAPNDNISHVPEGFSFGLPEPPNTSTVLASIVTCEISPDKDVLFKCLGHLNTVRKFLSKRFQANYFPNLYLKLKYYDKKQTGWLPKKTVYDYCLTQYIRFDTSLLEPLLSMWNALVESNIDYKMFVRIINYREPSPEIPKMKDYPEDCVDFRTTYFEMNKPGRRVDMRLRAGLPSGRYFDLDYPVTPDGCVKAHRAYLPHETDVKCCIAPSVLCNLGVSHRDMYAVRDPQTVRKVFEAAGQKFTDEQFNSVWDEAKKYSSKGLVCFQTFRQASEDVMFPDENKLPRLN